MGRRLLLESLDSLPRTLSPSSLCQTEVENFVLRVAAEFSSRKEQLIFLINNYDMMLGVLMVNTLLRQGLGGGAVGKEPWDPPPPGEKCKASPATPFMSPFQERAVEESKEVGGFQQLLNARTQVSQRAASSSCCAPPPQRDEEPREGCCSCCCCPCWSPTFLSRLS